MKKPEIKPTPGPWCVDDLGVVRGGPAEMTSICETPVVYWRNMMSTVPIDHERQKRIYNPMAEQAEANGRLIAAAPDLLEAAKASLGGKPSANQQLIWAVDKALNGTRE